MAGSRVSQHRETGFKFWLRGPADNPQVEIVAHRDGGSSRNAPQRAERSIMRELLGDEVSHDLEVTEGRWLLPGFPP